MEGEGEREAEGGRGRETEKAEEESLQEIGVEWQQTTNLNQYVPFD